MAETVTISHFKATCLALLAKVKRTGHPILVTRKGEVIAQILPPPAPEKPSSWLGSFQSSGKILGGSEARLTDSSPPPRQSMS